MYTIIKAELQYAGTLFIALKDNDTGQMKEFAFIFCGWRIRNKNGEILTAIFNDPDEDDEIIKSLYGTTVLSLWTDKFDCKMEINTGLILETFALHNDIENKGFYIDEVQ